MGNIKGPNSTKFGIYYGKTKNERNKKYRAIKAFQKGGSNDFDKLRKELLAVIEASRRITKFKEVDSLLSSMFKQKIMFLYNQSEDDASML